jgi:hypothetical protein
VKVQWTFFLLDSKFLEAFAVVFVGTTETDCRGKGIGCILRMSDSLMSFCSKNSNGFKV